MDRKEEKKLQKSYFDVLGLCCSSEVPLIENVLRKLDGVKDISVIVASRTVIVVHDTVLVSQLQIVNALNKARLEAYVKVHGESNHQKKWPSPYAVVCGVLLALSFLKYAYHPLRWLALGAVTAGIFPIICKGFMAIRNFRIDINILMLVAVIGTIAMQDYVEAATIVFLFSTSEWLESRASHKANAAMSSLMSIAPERAVLAESGEDVDVDEVKLNTLLSVRPGEAIPIDGVVFDGDSEVDEKTLTGESFPVPKHKDSPVLAGTINLNGYLTIKTTALAEDCAVARMAKFVEEAQNKKSRTQRFIDKCAKYYTPAVLLISIGFVVIPVALHVNNQIRWFRLALVVLVSACPCALVLSTPVVSFCALTKAAKSGLLIKGGDYLEILSKIKIMAFDKTGTITRGDFTVEDFQSLHGDIKSDTLLYWVSSIESKSSHPMADPLVEYGRSFSIEPKPEDVTDFQNFPGEGIYGKIDGQDIYIGNRKIALRSGCATVPSSEIGTRGKSIGYIYSGATLVGVFGISDACRTGASAAIKELKSLKIRTAMLTGDSWASAQHAQNQLVETLDALHAELLPEDKFRIIQGLKTEGLSAMVGDGINDAPALATADVGISMGISGSALAMDSGHVILMSNDIRKIPKAIRLARRARRKIIENVIMSIVTKAGILALGFEGHPLVWAAVLTDVGTCLLVILNSMLLLREGHYHQHGGSCQRSSSAPKCSTTMKSCHDSKGCCNATAAAKVCESQCAPKCQLISCEPENPMSKAKKCCVTDVRKPCNGNKQENVRESACCKSSHPAVSSCGDEKLCGSTQQRGCSSHARTDQSSLAVKIQEVCGCQDPPIRTCATQCQSSSCKDGKPISKAKKSCSTDARKPCDGYKLENSDESVCCKSSHPAISSCGDEKLCCSTEQRGCSSHGKTDQLTHLIEIHEVCESQDSPIKTCATKCHSSIGKAGNPISKGKNCCPSDAGKPCCGVKSECNSTVRNDHQHCTSKTKLQNVGESACCKSSHPAMSSTGEEKLCCSSERKGCSGHGGLDHSSHPVEIQEVHSHDCPETITLDTCKNSLCLDSTKNCCNLQISKISSGSGDCHERRAGKLSQNICLENHHQLHDGAKCCTVIDSSEADIEMGGDHVESTCRHACASLAQREAGGCCKSYMKECCRERHVHLGPSRGFGGRLSEIIIE